MKKKMPTKGEEFDKEALALLVRSLVQVSGLQDSRRGDVEELIADLEKSDDDRFQALGRALKRLATSEVLHLVDRIGRKRRGGQRGPRYDDVPLLAKMILRTRAGETLEAAARALALEAQGGSLESRAKRLKDAFRKIRQIE